jgi:hypothetical protein
MGMPGQPVTQTHAQAQPDSDGDAALTRSTSSDDGVSKPDPALDTPLPVRLTQEQHDVAAIFRGQRIGGFPPGLCIMKHLRSVISVDAAGGQMEHQIEVVPLCPVASWGVWPLAANTSTVRSWESTAECSPFRAGRDTLSRPSTVLLPHTLDVLSEGRGEQSGQVLP